MIAYYDPKTRRRVSTADEDAPPRKAPPGLIARWQSPTAPLDVRWYDETGRITGAEAAKLGITGKPGRPTSRGGKPITIRPTPELRERIEAAAAREHQTLTDWLIAAAELAIARGSTR